jgi:hypothetical protein
MKMKFIALVIATVVMVLGSLTGCEKPTTSETGLPPSTTSETSLPSSTIKVGETITPTSTPVEITVKETIGVIDKAH